MAKIPSVDEYFDSLLKVADKLEQESIAYGYPKVKKSKNDKKSTVAGIAQYTEYGKMDGSGGWERVPRKFMTYAEMLAEDASMERMERMSDPVMSGKLRQVSAQMKKEAENLGDTVREAILEKVYAPLKPSTIARKGHDTLLIETGDMYDSAEGVVVKNANTEDY